MAKRLATAPRAAELATWLFAAAAVGNLFVGRVPFAVGIAFAMGAWACVRRSPVAAAVLSLASVWASPVAGVYVCAGALAALVTGDRRTAIALGVPSLAGGVAMAAAFPEGGTDRFVATAFWPMLILSLCALALLDPRRRTMRWAAIFYLALLVAAFAFSNPLGQNALRPGLLLGPSLLVLCPRPGAPRAAIAVVCVGLVYLSLLPAVRALDEARGDPSSQAAYHADVLRFLAAHAQPGERLEVPLTVNHWEAYFLARRFPIARGWHRQLDRGANAVFYDGEPLTPARYERWLRRQRRPLDRPARRAAGLLGEGGAAAAAGGPAVPERGARLRRLAHLGGAPPRPGGLRPGPHHRRASRRVRSRGRAAGRAWSCGSG